MKSETIEQRRWVGRVLRDRWRIDERLSRGGVGTVYAATHKNNGSRAAIKVLHAEFARDADTRSRFLQEGYAANQVNHPGVVRILDDDTTEDGHAFLVMELLEGELLEKRRVRKGGMLPLAEVFEVGDQLLDVLAAAHDKSIVHRDIKPENLFITREGRLKVLDFGFAQMKSGFRKEQTATGFLLGTPGFMSPEQAVGNRALIDAKTDIWAVGATLFTLISGEPVHDGQSAAEMLVAAANFPPRSLATVASGLPPRLVELVDRAVAFDKNDRWPSARAMQAALKDIATRGGGAPHRPPQYSIPDRDPMSDTGEEATLYVVGDSVQELATDDLIDATSENLKTVPDNERTLMAQSQRNPNVKAPFPSEITKPDLMIPRVDPPRPAAGRPAQHGADFDGPTLAQPSPRDAMHELQRPMTMPIPEPPASGLPNHQPFAFGSEADPTLDQGTLIMEPGHMHREGSDPNLGQYPQSGNPGSHPYGMYGGVPSSQPIEPTPRHLRAPAAAGPPPSRVLVFVGVAIVTMVIVIVAGLLVLHFAD